MSERVAVSAGVSDPDALAVFDPLELALLELELVSVVVGDAEREDVEELLELDVADSLADDDRVDTGVCDRVLLKLFDTVEVRLPVTVFDVLADAVMEAVRLALLLDEAVDVRLCVAVEDRVLEDVAVTVLELEDDTVGVAV